MAQMNERMKALFNKVRTAVLATATVDGEVNAVPFGAKRIIDDETILISDQFFRKTRANLEANPRASVTFWEGHEGYQFKGKVTIETSGPRYEETAAWVQAMGDKAGFPLKSKGIAVMKIEAIYSVAPGPEAGRQLA
jgi:predicted pyridoxine 5'-phosphate oxidase superfamily flavin-nucleotide-binding protein